MKDLHTLPDGLPVPEDDGACNHLLGTKLPSVMLRSTSGLIVDISAINGAVAIFFYPMIGRPDSAPMLGWNDIPGARGCTPQACSFGDNYSKLEKQGVKLFGISSQPLVDQQAAQQRLNLPFELLNDSEFVLAKAMHLPTFSYKKSTYIKRITIIIENGVVKKTLYPVFPPNENVIDVIKWIENNKCA